MTTISIADSLWIEETTLGATLNFRSSERPGGVLFRVGISHDSLREVSSALTSSSCLWTIRDGSFTVYGDTEGVTLTFCSVQDNVMQSGISLYGEELAAFKTAVYACSCRRECVLN